MGRRDERAVAMRAGEDDVARLVAHEQRVDDARVRRVTDVDDAHRVREMVDDPDFTGPAHGHRDGLEPDLDRADRPQARAVDAKDLEPVVGRVRREEEVPVVRDGERTHLEGLEQGIWVGALRYLLRSGAVGDSVRESLRDRGGGGRGGAPALQAANPSVVTAQAVNAIQRMMELSFRRRLGDARLRLRHIASDDLATSSNSVTLTFATSSRHEANLRLVALLTRTGPASYSHFSGCARASLTAFENGSRAAVVSRPRMAAP